MREFRGDGGREAKADPEFRMDWKSERDNVRTERKDGREHRGGGGEGRESSGRRDGRESRSGGDSRERKSDDLRVNSVPESGELRESWGSRLFLKNINLPAPAAHVEEEGGIGQFTGDGGAELATTRFEEVKRRRDERDPPRALISINNNIATEREERQRDKSERRGGGGDLQVYISFGSSSQREKEKAEREEKAVEREKSEKEGFGAKQQKAKEKEESVAGKEKGSEVECSRREKESEHHRRKEATAAAPPVDQDDKDHYHQNSSAIIERADKRGGVSPPFGYFDEAAAVGGSSAGRSNADDALKAGAGGGGETELKERADGKEEKGKIVDVVISEEEKGKRKLRDFDRAGRGDDGNNNAADGGGEEYERELASSFAVPRKRMLRPRGHHQGYPTREVRPRFRAKDHQHPEPFPLVIRPNPSAENASLIYRVGGGLQEELRRIRKEFEDTTGKLTAEQAPTIEVRIPAELASTSNRQVQGSQLWGTDIYTDDSDLVAVLMHTGYYAATASSPPAAILELRATVRVLSPENRYASTFRNAVRSRAWGAASGCAFSVDSCHLLKKDGSKVVLEPRLTFAPAFAPTLAPAVSERTVTTRAVAMNAYRTQRFVQEVTIQYNLCNEPWIKYGMNIVADKGLKKSQYTSARLKKSDVLYVETHFHRYELSYEDTKVGLVLEKGKEKTDVVADRAEKATERAGPLPGGCSKDVVEKAGNNHHNGPLVGDKYRWALCKWPLSLQYMRSKGVPLPLDYVNVVESGLGWEEVQWSPAGVCVRGKEYPLARAHFVPHHE